MPDMVNMKRTKKDEDEVLSMDENPYPYGLEVRLDEGSMEKLDVDMMNVGSEVHFIAKAKVTSTSQYESENGGKDQSMCLQITDMGIVRAHDSDTVKRFYGEDGE